MPAARPPRCPPRRRRRWEGERDAPVVSCSRPARRTLRRRERVRRGPVRRAPNRCWNGTSLETPHCGG